MSSLQLTVEQLESLRGAKNTNEFAHLVAKLMETTGFKAAAQCIRNNARRSQEKANQITYNIVRKELPAKATVATLLNSLAYEFELCGLTAEATAIQEVQTIRACSPRTYEDSFTAKQTA